MDKDVLWRGVGLVALVLGGCGVLPDDPPVPQCSELAMVQQPPLARQLYPLAITHINGEAVAPRASVRLAPGAYQLTVEERIADPRFSSVSAPQQWALQLDAGVRYHLAAQLSLASEDGAWVPKVWRTAPAQCSRVE